MKLVSFEVLTPVGRRTRVGAVHDDAFVDLQTAYRLRLRECGLTDRGSQRLAEALLPSSMVEFIEGDDRTLDAAREALEWATGHRITQSEEGQVWFGRGECRSLAPVPEPPLIRDFMGFEEHLLKIYPKLGRPIPPEWYRMPVYYKSNPARLSGNGDAIAIPSYADVLDFEFELAAVIGHGGRDIPASDAAGHIYGFMIYNDFSAREIQAREMSVGLGPAKGKDFDGGHAFGPYLVTADEVPNIYDVRMLGRVNGEVWTDAGSGTIHWTFEEMIRHASTDEHLRAGDIFGSGTVGNGSGAERDQFLAAGDRIELEVEGLGVLANTISARAPTATPPAQ